MKILHCNTYTNSGGAAIAAMRLHRALCSEGTESYFGTARGLGSDASIISLFSAKREQWRYVCQRAESAALVALGKKRNFLFSPGLLPSFTHVAINKFSVDIVHLHWLANAFLPLTALSRIYAPVVWTLHDMWAFTGGCHYAEHGCRQYESRCGACPLVPRSLWPLVALNFAVKKRLYQKQRPTVICPSRSFLALAQKSTLLWHCKLVHIPNTIDTQAYAPMEKGKARSELGVGWEEAVLAFGAEGGSADRRKGYDILQAALERLHLYHEGPVRLLVFGGEKKTGMIASYPVIFLGHLNTDYALRCAYCAADVFVCPSRDDNLPNTIVESLACGTPVAAFAVGGIPDMVQDNVNGCLATPHDPEELARCIASILGSSGFSVGNPCQELAG